MHLVPILFTIGGTTLLKVLKLFHLNTPGICTEGPGPNFTYDVLVPHYNNVLHMHRELHMQFGHGASEEPMACFLATAMQSSSII